VTGRASGPENACVKNEVPLIPRKVLFWNKWRKKSEGDWLTQDYVKNDR